MSNILERIDGDLIEPQRLVGSMIDELIVERRRPPEKRRGSTVREALTALQFEAQLFAVAAENLSRGIPISDDERARLLIAWAPVDAIYREVMP